MSEDHAKQTLEIVVNRIGQETDLAEELEDILPVAAIKDVTSYVRAHKKNLSKETIERIFRFLEWLYPKAFRGLGEQIVNIEGAAAIAGRIWLPEGFPELSSKQKLQYLAISGLPGDFFTIYHELIHTLQIRNISEMVRFQLGTTAGYIIEYRSNKAVMLAELELTKIPGEAHAHYAMFEANNVEGQKVSSTLGGEDRMSTIIRGTLNSVKMLTVIDEEREGGAVQRIMKVTEYIEKMRALGLSHAEVAQIVIKARWNRDQEDYLSLKNEIHQRSIQSRILPEELGDLVKWRQARRDARIHAIRSIASGEITKSMLSTGNT